MNMLIDYIFLEKLNVNSKTKVDNNDEIYNGLIADFERKMNERKEGDIVEIDEHGYVKVNDEILDENSYISSDEINQIDFSFKEKIYNNKCYNNQNKKC